MASSSTDKRNSFSMSSLMHSVKKVAFNKETSEDADFEQLKGQFTALNTSLVALRQHLTVYQTSFKNLFSSSQSVAVDFSELLCDSEGAPNPCENQVSDLKKLHDELLTDERAGQRLLDGQLEDGISRKVNEQISEHNIVFKKIEERTAKRSDYNYYKNKVDELQEEKNKRQEKGKAESAKDLEKWERNQQKLMEAQTAYDKLNAEIMEDIRVRLATRFQTFGAGLNDFIRLEKAFAETYSEALSDVSVSEGSAPH